MSKISLSPDASGTGIFTIASPNSNTNRTLTLPDDTGTIVTNSGNQAGSFTTLNTSGAVVFNDAGADVDFRVEGDTNANLLFVDASADAVGIGTSSPASGTGASLDATGPLLSGGAISAHQTSRGVFQYSGNETTIRSYGATAGTGSIVFNTGGGGGSADTERMRITSAGAVLVGQTTLASNTVGASIQQSGVGIFTRDGDISLLLNRKTSDGNILEFRKDGTTVGSILADAGFITVGSSTVNLNFRNDSPHARIIPRAGAGSASNGVIDLGDSGSQFADIYLVNNPIVSSDQNVKQDISELTEAETRVAISAKSLLRKYRLKDAFAEKGENARIHFGIIAQDLKAAFEAEGLDAGRYAMFIHSEWWETQTEVPAVEAQEAVYETHTDEEGNETQVLVSEAVEGKEAYTRTDTYETEAEAPEGAVRKERMGIRYNELLAFIIAAI